MISKNKYSVMCLLFIMFHNFWIAGYYVRYFLPVLFLLVLSFDQFVYEKPHYWIDNFTNCIRVPAVENIYLAC